MKLGILSDTHDDAVATRAAVGLLLGAGAEALVHCGDIANPVTLRACSGAPLWFVYGNHDADNVPRLEAAAAEMGATPLGWAGEFTLAGKRIGVAHGHMTMDLRPLLEAKPDYLVMGHTHEAAEWEQGGVRRINPGALHRAEAPSYALLDLSSGGVRWIRVD